MSKPIIDRALSEKMKATLLACYHLNQSGNYKLTKHHSLRGLRERKLIDSRVIWAGKPKASEVLRIEQFVSEKGIVWLRQLGLLNMQSQTEADSTNGDGKQKEEV